MLKTSRNFNLDTVSQTDLVAPRQAFDSLKIVKTNPNGRKVSLKVDMKVKQSLPAIRSEATITRPESSNKQHMSNTNDTIVLKSDAV